jgi:hypothetical protein
MNDKIRELVEQVTKKSNWITTENTRLFALLSENDLEKLAELIVRECLNFECEAGVYTKHDMADAIKRHFGVNT